MSILSVSADDVLDKFNTDYFRSPEAAAFKKYGEESVNEYTGTADISVPLYTIKSKDIEIPLVLRYDASGIKVEQEASWVGLGWNLMVGGCINYVCAGALDQKMDCSSISTKTWTEYLTNMKTPNSNGTQYFNYGKNNINTWMETVNHSFAFDSPYRDQLSMDMRNYLMWGYGERDFYSVNVLGKSFKFFIDPATLNYHIIGEAGEGYKIDFGRDSYDQKGIGNPRDISEWTITDSNGYIYFFNNADVIHENGGHRYNSCWYLTEIQTPLGEKVKLTYTKCAGTERTRLTESYTIVSNSTSNTDAKYGSKGVYHPYIHYGSTTTSYLNEIKTSNQTITFSTTESNQCSGRKLDAITVKSNNTVIKTIKFTYGSFEYDKNIGGNLFPAKNATAELRLKLNNIKEIASGETLTTSFSYNSLKLPSRSSCAQDYWGYYNGYNNLSTSSFGHNGHTMLPTPINFMTKNYNKELEKIQGANRNSNGKYMQAAILDTIVYPTGGYTTYEYEPNTCVVTQSQSERPYDIDIKKYFSYTPNVPAGVKTVANDPLNFTLKESLDYSLDVYCDGDAINGSTISIIIVSINSGFTSTQIPVTYKSSNDPIKVKMGTLPAGNYQLIIGAPSEGNKGYGICCNLTGYYKSNTSAKQTQNTFTKTVGGLRVKKISNYDNDKSLINYVTYNYNDDKGVTTGKLLDVIETIEDNSYTYYKSEPNGWGPNTVYSEHSIWGWNITSGQSLFPAFYASCNPGIVGYTQVTKCKYNAKGDAMKYVITKYENNEPKSMTYLNYYTSFANGKIISQETRDASKKIISKVVNEYHSHDLQSDDERDKWYSTNMVARDMVVIEPGIGYFDEYNIAGFKRFQVWKYPYILSRVDLTKTTTTEYCSDGKQIVRTKEYKYKNNNENIQVAQIDENTSWSKQIQRTKITYTSDGTDAASRSMKSLHRLNDVVENKVVLVENGKEQGVSTQRTNYAEFKINGSKYYLPDSYLTSIGKYAPENRAIYTYDDSLNVSSIALDGMETVYLWSYKGQYPVAKIEGLTYAEVENAITKSTISELLRSQTPNSTTVSSIRTKINAKGGYITTYTYKPLVGILSETQPNGNIIYYEYDSFGRLKNIKDYNKKIIKTYEYHYYDKK